MKIGDHSAIGERIKALRRWKGLTQDGLGSKCSPPMTSAQIRKYESNKSIPKEETIRRIAKAMDIPFGYLVHDIASDGSFLFDTDEGERYGEIEDKILDLYKNGILKTGIKDFLGEWTKGKQENDKRILALGMLSKTLGFEPAFLDSLSLEKKEEMLSKISDIVYGYVKAAAAAPFPPDPVPDPPSTEEA